MNWVRQKVAHARKQREILQGMPPVTAGQPLAYAAAGSQPPARKKPGYTPRLLVIIAAWIVTLVAAWLLGSNVSVFTVGTGKPGKVGTIRIEELADYKSHLATSVELENRLDELSGRLQQLSDNIANVEAGLTRVLVLADSMPGPASGNASDDSQRAAVPDVKPASALAAHGASAMSDASAITHADTDSQVSSSNAGTKAFVKAAPGSAGQITADAETGSPWVINLVSVPDKADAEQFAAMARSNDIPVELYAVTVKGKDYWRVQASGFSTADEARSRATSIRQQLGLKDVWVSKR